MAGGFSCLICGNPTTSGFRFCNACGKENGLVNENGKFLKPTQWPDWARELYNEGKRLERKEKNIRYYETDEEYDDETGGVKKLDDS